MSESAHIIGALVGHFFRHSFRRATTWLIFVVAPVLAIVGMSLIVAEDALGVLVFTSGLEACIIAMLAVKEKELGIYRRILVTPVTGFTYSLSLFLAVYLVLAVEIILVLAGLYAIPPVRPALPFLPLVGVLLTYGAAASAFGVLLTALVSSSTQGSVVANIVVITSSFLSGCFWPISIMPNYLQEVAKAFPQTWTNLAIDELVALQTASSSPGETGVMLAVPALYAVVFLLGYALLYRRDGR